MVTEFPREDNIDSEGNENVVSRQFLLEKSFNFDRIMDHRITPKLGSSKTTLAMVWISLAYVRLGIFTTK